MVAASWEVKARGNLSIQSLGMGFRVENSGLHDILKKRVLGT